MWPCLQSPQVACSQCVLSVLVSVLWLSSWTIQATLHCVTSIDSMLTIARMYVADSPTSHAYAAWSLSFVVEILYWWHKPLLCGVLLMMLACLSFKGCMNNNINMIKGLPESLRRETLDYSLFTNSRVPCNKGQFSPCAVSTEQVSYCVMAWLTDVCTHQSVFVHRWLLSYWVESRPQLTLWRNWKYIAFSVCTDALYLITHHLQSGQTQWLRCMWELLDANHLQVSQARLQPSRLAICEVWRKEKLTSYPEWKVCGTG